MAPLTLSLPTIESTRLLAESITQITDIPSCITLSGDLGAGKTTFSQFFIRHLCGDTTEVTSPTFTLVQTYDGKTGPIWHYDMYRLDHEDEIVELAFEDALDSAITLVEWPEKIPSYVPVDRLDITLNFSQNDEGREVTLLGHGSWSNKLETLNLDWNR